MKIKYFLPLLALTFLFPGCKTSEKNYRKAYEVTAEYKRKKTGLEDAELRSMNQRGHVSYLIVDTDSLPMRTEIIGYTKDGGATETSVKKYNVAVARFSQLFNAREMRKRLQGLGYEAFILHDREPEYYVLSATTDVPEEARTELNRVQNDTSLTLHQPFPLLLHPANK